MLNERGNMAHLIERLGRLFVATIAKSFLSTMISADGTAEYLRVRGRDDRRIRCIQRVGRRGLSSACIEGLLSTSARYIAVIDGDLQQR
jgi:dolichol-phosphate mannosyltransferase